MKMRLNLTKNKELLLAIKAIAHKKLTSVSRLIEEYFKVKVKPSGCKKLYN